MATSRERGGFILGMRSLSSRLLRSVLGSLALLLAASVHGAGLEPAEDWTPLQIEVKDQEGKGFERFGYRDTLINQQGAFASPKDLKSENGSIRLKAPAQCQIYFSIDHPEALGGYGSGGEAFRKEGEASVTGKIQRGVTVRGRVLAEADGKPVVGALVMPMKLTIPVFEEDRERGRLTDAEGKFELPGVSVDARWSFAVEHADFADKIVGLIYRQYEDPVEVKLQPGESLSGVTRDSKGKPLAGVEVKDGSSKKTLSGEDGTFVLHGVQKPELGPWRIFAGKEGYETAEPVAVMAGEHEVRLGRLSEAKGGGSDRSSFGLDNRVVVLASENEIRLEALPEIKGRVSFADGSPATGFIVSCEPEGNRGNYWRLDMPVKDAGGNFAIRPEKTAESGRYWLGIRAAGAAPWDEMVTAGPSGTERSIVLSAGRKLTARLAVPDKAKGPFAVQLESADPEDECSGVFDLLKVEAMIQRDEPLLIGHLRPGKYVLTIRGKNATPLAQPVTIKGEDVDAGELRLAGTGTIFGKASKFVDDFPKFSRGFVKVGGVDRAFGSGIRFRTDAEGNFRIEGAPTGKLRIEFAIQTGCTSMDVSGAIELREGEEREVKVGPFGMVR